MKQAIVHHETKRVDTIDVARGLAMLMVFINHGIVWFGPQTPGWIVAATFRASDFCIPMFMAISGMTMAYLLAWSTRGPSTIRRRYIRRGMSLLVVGHVLITLGIWPMYWHERTLLDVFLLRWHITDTIAVCLFLAPPLIMRLSAGQRLAWAVGLIVTCRAVSAFWIPANPLMGGFQEFLCGIGDYNPSPVLDTAYPLGPCLAMFLLGTILGPMYQAAVGSGTLMPFLKRFAIVLSGLFVLGTAMTLAYVFCLRNVLDPVQHRSLLGFFYPSRVSVLMPVYLAVGGAILMAVVLSADHWRHFGPLTFALVVIGRTSFFAYVVQYFLIQGIPTTMGLTHSVRPWQFPPLMVFFAALMFLICYTYARWKGIVPPGEYNILREQIRGVSRPSMVRIREGVTSH